MTTIVTVHGTFAHVTEVGFEGPQDTSLPGATAGASAPVSGVPSPWWLQDSDFGRCIGQLKDAAGHPVTIEPFIWSGANSESGRRAAGRRLFDKLAELEARGEDYAIVAHSHGGSLASWALLESVRRNVQLDHLQKWITVGTPFVSLRRERYLFNRLPMLLKAVFVASLMLLFMFLFYAVNDYLARGLSFDESYRAWRFGISATLASLPFIVFFLVAWIWDARQLFFYRRRAIRKARERYGAKWVGLCHEDDEAVQGLGSLKSLNVPIFDRGFALPVVSLLSVFILPLAYLYAVFSPSTMIALTEFLKTRVYDVAAFERVETGFLTARAELRAIRREMQRVEDRRSVAESAADVAKVAEAQAELRKLAKRRVELRESLKQAYPDMLNLQRAARFVRRFLRKNDLPCEHDTLCEGGRNLAINSRLLLHLVTDEASSLLVDEDVRWSAFGRIVRYLVPVVLVPIVFGLVAMALVLLVQWVAAWLSGLIARQLDRSTWKQIRRSALGNDTESEVAVSAIASPPWLDVPPTFLPAGLRDIITTYSNKAMSESLGKIRNAISDLAFADGGRRSDVAASVIGYLNWKELIHTSYFEVPEFCGFLVHVLTDGKPGAAGQPVAGVLEPAIAAEWLAALRPAEANDPGELGDKAS
jgi:hypothetical protein